MSCFSHGIEPGSLTRAGTAGFRETQIFASKPRLEALAVS